MNITEKRKATLVNFVFYAFIIAAYYLFMKFAFWLVAPFIFAFLIGMLLQKPVRAISKNKNKKRHCLGGCGFADYRNSSQRNRACGLQNSR